MCSRKTGSSFGSSDQKWGNEMRPVGYFSVTWQCSTRWQACLRVVAGIAVLGEEASEPSMGQFWTVITSHQAQSVLETKGHWWMMGGWLTKYQARLLDTPEEVRDTCQTSDPAALMPRPDCHTSVEHNCSEVIDLVYSRRSDLEDSPIGNADDNWFIDGSYSMVKGMLLSS